MPDRLRQLVGSDEALLLDVDARLGEALASWVRLAPDRASDARRGQARVYVHQAPLLGVEVPRVEPALRVGTVGVWVQETGRAVLGSGEGDCAGAVDLDVLQATVVTSGAQGRGQRLHTMLGMAVGLLLGRLGRALVCGAVVAPPGRGAWLLVGEEGAAARETAHGGRHRDTGTWAVFWNGTCRYMYVDTVLLDHFRIDTEFGGM